jgi:hypothetical protein
MKSVYHGFGNVMENQTVKINQTSQVLVQHVIVEQEHINVRILAVHLQRQYVMEQVSEKKNISYNFSITLSNFQMIVVMARMSKIVTYHARIQISNASLVAGVFWIVGVVMVTRIAKMVRMKIQLCVVSNLGIYFVKFSQPHL